MPHVNSASNPASPRTTRGRSAFALSDYLNTKYSPELIETDERFFAELAQSLHEQRTRMALRLKERRVAVAHAGSSAVERDVEIKKLSSRLSLLEHFGIDVCLGRMDPSDGGKALDIGRIGVRGLAGEPLLTDWRAPVARPFFAATRLNPMGLRSIRRYRWSSQRIADYWDEVLEDLGEADVRASFDTESEFIANLSAQHSDHMRDVLATIQSDQDAIIRADAHGPLVVEGGPGTGKSVVALHRAAYLMYEDRRIEHSGGILFVGPSESFLRYVEDVLPGLGENGVKMASLRELVPENSQVLAEDPPAVAALKASMSMVRAVDAAVRLYEEPPTSEHEVSTPWGDATVTAQMWRAAFASVTPGTPHNEAQDEVLDGLVLALSEVLTGGAEEEDFGHVASFLRRDGSLVKAVRTAWPILDPVDVIADLWSVPAYTRYCLPDRNDDDVALLQRNQPRQWTSSDLPLLDAARYRLGDPNIIRHRQSRAAKTAQQHDRMKDVIGDLVASDDSELMVMSLLTQADMQEALEPDQYDEPTREERLSGPFGYIIVDEAQELTDAQWMMIVRRCPSRSLTIVGDRAQARGGFPETWKERLERIGLRSFREETLHVNYRTPEEVMPAAEAVITRVLPDVAVPVSVRRSGFDVLRGSHSECADALRQAVSRGEGGTACVVGYGDTGRWEACGDTVSFMTPEAAKGLEFDVVVVDRPATWGSGITAAVDQYVAMTRTTRQLIVCE